MSNVIRQHNYTKRPVESCIAISPDGKTAVGLYVDDVYNCGPDTALIDAINKQYPLKHLGEAQVIIGMGIQPSETYIKIHQQQYIAGFRATQYINNIQSLLPNQPTSTASNTCAHR
eukprot:Pgem_evm1s16970